MDHSFEEFKTLVLGGKSLGFYLAAFWFSFLAIMLSQYLHSKTRDVSSANTPIRFSWYFLIWDNSKRSAAGLTVMFLLYRFTPLISMGLAVGIGFFVSIGVDKAIQFLMGKFDFLSMNRDNLPAKP